MDKHLEGVKLAEECYAKNGYSEASGILTTYISLNKEVEEDLCRGIQDVIDIQWLIENGYVIANSGD